MRSTLKALLDRISFHPRKAILVAYLDGELKAAQARKVEAHLNHCLSCRDRLDELSEGLAFFERTSASSATNLPLADAFRSITKAVRDHSVIPQPSSPTSSEPPVPAVYSRLKSELTIYLGDHAATELLERCNHSLLKRDRLNEIIKPVITTLLGQETGTAVVANMLRIWDRSQQVAG
jgi:hypothetical protein